MREFFILADENRRESVLNFLRIISLKKPVSVEIKEYKKNRSNAQNRTYWMWLKVLSVHTGYDDDELHETLKIRLLGTDSKMILGENMTLPKSTTKLNMKEFADYLGKIEMMAETLCVKLPHPDDYRFAMMIDEIPAAPNASLPAGDMRIPSPHAVAPEGSVDKPSGRNWSGLPHSNKDKEFRASVKN